MVVFLPPSLHQHLRLQHAAKLLRVQQLVPNLAVERLGVTVLPRHPRRDVPRLPSPPTSSAPDGLSDELRAVVAADSAPAPRAPARPPAPLSPPQPSCPIHLQRQALAGVLVDQREPLQGRPSAVRSCRRPTSTHGPCAPPADAHDCCRCGPAAASYAVFWGTFSPSAATAGTPACG